MVADVRETPRPVGGRIPDAEPCPFCGSDDLGYYEYVYAQNFTVTCKACGGQGPRRSSQEEARTLWNGRTGLS